MTKTLAACTDCGRSGVTMMQRNPPRCKRCYGRQHSRDKAKLRAEIDAAHDEANRQQALRRAAGVGVRTGARPDLLLGSVVRQPWRSRAACHGVTKVFFDDDTTEAAAICAGCEVRPECAAWAISDETQLGFAGGLSEQQRKAARKRTA